MQFQRSEEKRQGKKLYAVSLVALVLVLAGVMTYVQQSQELRSKASGLSCPVVNKLTYSSSNVIPSYGLSYPAVVAPDTAHGEWLLFAGGLDSQMDKNIRVGLSAAYEKYAGSQEEVWSFQSRSLNGSWGLPKHSFSIVDSTSVAFKNNQSYASVFPNGYRLGCGALPKTQCNVQINDPSIVRYNNALYMYFSILENYRWYDGTLGDLTASGSSNPKDQNIHAIGLAVSGDNGAHWAFVDKVIVESGNKARVNGGTEDVLGAWAPSAIVMPDGSGVDIYFHDALGTKQYVAHLKGGVSVTSIDRLNIFDRKYRVNLDVVRNGANMEILYNDKDFNIVSTVVSDLAQFGLCPSVVIVPSSKGVMWPTPNQILTSDGKHHLFFWEFGKPQYIHHWSAE